MAYWTENMFLNIMLFGGLFIFYKLLVTCNQVEKTGKRVKTITVGKKNQFLSFSQDDVNLKKRIKWRQKYLSGFCFQDRLELLFTFLFGRKKTTNIFTATYALRHVFWILPSKCLTVIIIWRFFCQWQEIFLVIYVSYQFRNYKHVKID